MNTTHIGRPKTRSGDPIAFLILVAIVAYFGWHVAGSLVGVARVVVQPGVLIPVGVVLASLIAMHVLLRLIGCRGFAEWNDGRLHLFLNFESFCSR